MALGTTNISVTLVGNTIGNDSGEVGVLCTASTIKAWSRIRPGYWKLDDVNNILVFQKPRGGGYIDPRGTNPETGDNKDGYRLGDFRGYNHNPQIPSVVTPSVTENYIPSDGDTDKTFSIGFYIGEIFWQNTIDDTGYLYRERNALRKADGTSACTHLYVKRNGDSNFCANAVIGTTQNANIVITGVPIHTPASGAADVTVNYEIFIGDDPSPTTKQPSVYYKIDGVEGASATGSYTAHTYQNPSVTVTTNDFTILSSGGSVSQGQTSLSYNVTPDNLGINVACTAHLQKNGVEIDSQQIILKDNTQYNGSFTLATAADWDENYVVYITKN